MNTIKHAKMKQKNRIPLENEKKLQEAKLQSRNLIKGINTWAVAHWNILKVGERKTSTNKPENKKIHDDV